MRVVAYEAFAKILPILQVFHLKVILDTMSSTSVESNMRNVRLLVATWNAGNAEPDPSQFKHIMPDKGEGYDLIVIGLQESTYALGASKTDDDEPAAPAATSDDASANNSLLLPCVENLSKKFCNHLGSNFYMVAHNRRAQLQLFVFARITLQNAISNIEKTSENTGFMHVFPNKVRDAALHNHVRIGYTVLISRIYI